MEDIRVLRALWLLGNVGLAYAGRDGAIREVNPAFSRLVGYSEVELQGKHFRFITHPADVDADTEMARRVTEGEIGQYEMIKSYIHKDGQSVLARLMVLPVRTESGEVEYLLAEVTRAAPTFIAPSIATQPRGPSALAKFFAENKEITLKMIATFVSLLTALTILVLKYSESL
jgi:PAS domain S-box-containing protein